MTLACEISDEIVPRVLNECLKEYIRHICPHLEDSIIELKNKVIARKEENEDYIKIMITIANNLDMFADSIGKLEKYLERVEKKPFKWTRIRNRKRISIISQSSIDASTSKLKEKCLSRKMQ
uniref:MIF4G domain-containing protein n=1 Tax=Elaeophora elaphi TaxID=1147741 RepID=A0A0R3RLE4_9BILA